MGVDDMHFDILVWLEKEVSHLSGDRRRKASLALARRAAENFLHSAEVFEFDDEESNRSGSDSEDSSSAEGDGEEHKRRADPSRDRGPPPKAPRQRFTVT